LAANEKLNSKALHNRLTIFMFFSLMVAGTILTPNRHGE